MPQKNTRIPTRKIFCGILAVVFLIFLAQTYGLTTLSLTIDTAYATHINPFICAGDPDEGIRDGFVCAISLATNYAIYFAVGLGLSFVTVFLVGPLWFSMIVLTRLVLWLLFELVAAISAVFTLVSIGIIQSAVLPGAPIAQNLLYNPNLLEGIRTTLWTPVRDIVNVGFALLLIVGAIFTVIKASKDVIAQYGPKFMIAIVLVNFSWFIPRVVLDVANVAAVASFSLAQCPGCVVIRSVEFSPPDACIPDAATACPTLFLKITRGPAGNDDAGEAMGGLFGPFGEILDLPILPRLGNLWNRISKLFIIYNDGTQDSNFDIIRFPPPMRQNPTYPSEWIGIGNIFRCTWESCNDPPIPINGQLFSAFNTNVQPPTVSLNIQPYINNVIGMFAKAIMGSIRILVLILLASIFLILYIFALVALMAMVLLRIPIIWITLGFMPVVALAFVLGHGGLGGGLWSVWNKFVAAAFIPAVIGIPIAAGSLVLNTASSIRFNIMTTGIIAEIFGPDGLIQIMFIIIAIIVIWMGVFMAIQTFNFAGAAQQALAGSIRNLGSGAAKAVGYGIAAKAPLLPLGTALKATGAGMAGMGKVFQPLKWAGMGWEKIGGKKPGVVTKVLNLPGRGIETAGKWIYGGGLEKGAGKVAKGIGNMVKGVRTGLGKVFDAGPLQKMLVGTAMKTATGDLNLGAVLSDYSKGNMSLADTFRKHWQSGPSQGTAEQAANALHRQGDAPRLLEAINKLGKAGEEIHALEDIRQILRKIARDNGLNINTDHGLHKTVGAMVNTVMQNSSHPLYSTFQSGLGGKSGVDIEDALFKLDRAATTPPPPEPPPAPPPGGAPPPPAGGGS